MLLTILGRRDAERYRPLSVPAGIVSVTDPLTPPARLEERLYKHLIRLQFKDAPNGQAGSISQQQALQLAAFFLTCEREKIGELVIHCEAGISRSVGIALAACRIFDLDRSVCFVESRVPNRVVAARVLLAYRFLRQMKKGGGALI